MNSRRKRTGMKKYLIRGLILGILAVAWGVRVWSFNRQIAEIKQTPVIRKDMTGEWVELGDNYIGNTALSGYSIQIQGSRIVDAMAYAREVFGEESAQRTESFHSGEKICEVKALIKNTDNTDTGIDFLSAFLLGEDFYAGVWLDGFNKVNGIEETTLGNIRLHTGSEYSITIPYLFIDTMYREKPGRKLENEKMWMLLTGYPEEIQARVR